MRIVKRIAEVYQQRGLRGVAAQTGAKIADWHRRATFKPHVIEKTLSGHTFTVAINNLFAQGVVEQRVQWPELEWIQEHLLEEGDFVVDCGANIGFSSIFFAHFVGPSGRVVALEPHPANAKDIRQNVNLNGLTNVEVIEKAVGSSEGIATLTATSNGTLTTDRNGDTIDVAVVRLDDVILSDKPDLLKIDVEGYEFEVLRGASRILECRPKLDVEIHPFLHANRLEHCENIFELLNGIDYDLYVQPDVDGEIYPIASAACTLTELAAKHVFNIYATPH